MNKVKLVDKGFLDCLNSQLFSLLYFLFTNGRYNHICGRKVSSIAE